MIRNQRDPNERRPIFHGKEEMEWIDVTPGERVSIRVKGEDVEGAYSVFDLIMEPSYGVPIHIHTRGDEIFRVIEGKARFHVDGKEFDAEVGEIVLVPKGTTHAFANFGNSPLHLAIMFTPAGDEHSFNDVFEKSPDEIKEIMETRYQIFIVGEPLKKVM